MKYSQDRNFLLEAHSLQKTKIAVVVRKSLEMFGFPARMIDDGVGRHDSEFPYSVNKVTAHGTYR